MAFIEGKLFHDKRMNLMVYENTGLILLVKAVMGFIRSEFFHDKRTNMASYKKFPVDFIGRESW
jgi:hypothetical protein